jgi:hypothetical protein
MRRLSNIVSVSLARSHKSMRRIEASSVKRSCESPSNVDALQKQSTALEIRRTPREGRDLHAISSYFRSSVSVRQ